VKARGGARCNPATVTLMCEQRKHGSVGAGAGNRPGYLTVSYRARVCLGILVVGSEENYVIARTAITSTA
jgi:hypothetical protein